MEKFKPMNQEEAIKLLYQAIDEKKIIKVSFHSFEKGIIERYCVPYDYAASSRAKDKTPKLQFYDLDSPSGESHNLPLFPMQIYKMEITNTTFNPEDFVTWAKKGDDYGWVYKRDWGKCS